MSARVHQVPRLRVCVCVCARKFTKSLLCVCACACVLCTLRSDPEPASGRRRSANKTAHGFFTRTSWCSYPSAPASGCARSGPVLVPRCAPTRLLLVPRARATRSYSCARYLVFAPTRPLLVRYSPATRPLLVAALRSYLFATRARRVRAPVGARGCAVPLLPRTRSLPLYPPPAVLPEQARAPSQTQLAPRAHCREKQHTIWPSSCSL